MGLNGRGCTDLGLLGLNIVLNVFKLTGFLSDIPENKPQNSIVYIYVNKCMLI